jgi:hypothetical protein
VLRKFALRQDQVFLRRDCGGGTPPAHGFASSVLEYTHASATLIDTKLRKSFRRKNTRRKSFLGHARRLNDLPIEAATTRPTLVRCPPATSFAVPRAAATGAGTGQHSLTRAGDFQFSQWATRQRLGGREKVNFRDCLFLRRDFDGIDRLGEFRCNFLGGNLLGMEFIEPFVFSHCAAQVQINEDVAVF